MTTLEQAARQTLEALEIGYQYAHDCAEQFHIEIDGYKHKRHETMDAEVRQIADSIAALRHALEQLNQFNPDWATQAVLVEEMQRMAKRIEELESATPQPTHEWVGLTDVEINDALIDLPVFGEGYFLRIARAIEAKLKEKNGV